MNTDRQAAVPSPPGDAAEAAAATTRAPSSFIAGAFSAIKSKGLKYSMVSVVNVLVGGGLLVLLQHWFQPDVANVMSVAASALPAYYMNRAWVWGKRGRSHWKREVMPFWGFVLVGLVFSTLAIHYAQDHTQNKLAILFVQLFVFGILWVLRFFLFDRLFHLEQDADDSDDQEPETGEGASPAEPV